MLTPELFERPTLEVAQFLLGVELTYKESSGIIVETEAYTDDPASHWITRPKKGRLLGESHGLIYVYTIYGVHRCLNFTTDKAGPGAVLIRAIEPVSGIDRMRSRRMGRNRVDLANGPAKLFVALGLHDSLNGEPVLSQFSMTRVRLYNEKDIATSSRIGISKGKDLPWRFFVRDNRHVSRL